MPEAKAPGRGGDGPGADLHAVRALDAATAAGLTPGELQDLLKGRLATDLVPPWPGEDPDTYADRATGELMVLYLGADGDDPSRPR